MGILADPRPGAPVAMAGSPRYIRDGDGIRPPLAQPERLTLALFSILAAAPRSDSSSSQVPPVPAAEFAMCDRPLDLPGVQVWLPLQRDLRPLALGLGEAATPADASIEIGLLAGLRGLAALLADVGVKRRALLPPNRIAAFLANLGEEVAPVPRHVAPPHGHTGVLAPAAVLQACQAEWSRPPPTAKSSRRRSEVRAARALMRAASSGPMVRQRDQPEPGSGQRRR